MSNKKKFTNDVLLKALEECMQEPMVPAVLIAEKLKANPRYISNLLIELQKEGILEGNKRANVLFFRPITKPQ
jgi:DNA-binding IscR family transcriptional regulator